jgi:hypothetical protein
VKFFIQYPKQAYHKVNLRLLPNLDAFVVDDAKHPLIQRCRQSLRILQLIQKVLPTLKLSIAESGDAEIL